MTTDNGKFLLHNTSRSILIEFAEEKANEDDINLKFNDNKYNNNNNLF